MSRKLPLTPRSSIQGIEWPALSSPNGRTILSILHQFEQSEWWSGDEIRAWQFRQLGGLLAHACKNVPYYRERLKEYGVQDPNSVTPEEWRKLPFLRRADIQAAGKKIHSQLIPRGHGKVGDIYTSGTTGEPIRVLQTALWGLFWSAFTLRDHLWQERDFSGKLAVIRNSAKGKDPYPDGTKSPRWGASDLVYKTGPGVSLNINCSVAEQVDWLEREKPKYFLSHPTNVYGLANYCLENDIRLNGLEQVQTISEILRPEVRNACKAAWGVSVADMYTGRDVGYLALQCPDSGDYHVQSEGVLLEILDDEGEVCPPGQTGRVVVTTLQNFAMPLIRYEIGDYAEAGGACSCGRGLPVLKRILGREQDMVTLPGGEKRWTLLSSGNIASFLEIAPIRQYQFVQKSVDRIEVRLAVERDLSDDETTALRQWVVAKLDYPFSVDFSFVDEIARESSGKYRDFVSEVV